MLRRLHTSNSSRIVSIYTEQSVINRHATFWLTRFRLTIYPPIMCILRAPLKVFIQLCSFSTDLTHTQNHPQINSNSGVRNDMLYVLWSFCEATDWRRHYYGSAVTEWHQPKSHKFAWIEAGCGLYGVPCNTAIVNTTISVDFSKIFDIRWTPECVCDVVIFCCVSSRREFVIFLTSAWSTVIVKT